MTSTLQIVLSMALLAPVAANAMNLDEYLKKMAAGESKKCPVYGQ